MFNITGSYRLCPWENLPSEALIEIFKFLSSRDLCRCCQVCKDWNGVGNVSYLWQRRFRIDFNVPLSIPIHSAAKSWKDEYQRVTDFAPRVECHKISSHNDRVSHVAFSNNGTMFSTCSRDATVKVFNADWPFDAIFTEHFGRKVFYRWCSTQFSQFNDSDTQLLVSGQSLASDSGEIIIYSISAGEFFPQALVRVDPHDVMGCWLNDSHILSSRCHTLHLSGHFLTEIHLNRSSQEVENPRQSTVSKLFTFVTDFSNPLSFIQVANMTNVMSSVFQQMSHGIYTAGIHALHLRAYEELQQKLPNLKKGSHKTSEMPLPVDATQIDKEQPSLYSSFKCNINVSEDDFMCSSSPPVERFLQDNINKRKDLLASDTGKSVFTEEANLYDFESTIQESNKSTSPKSYKLLLAFRYACHQISIKRITQEECGIIERRTIDLQSLQTSVPSDSQELRDPDTDHWDHVINVGGQLVGMVVSPCGQYLYASYRKYVSGTTQFSPQLTISLYDLISMEEITTFDGGTALGRSFFLYLSCNSYYVASGSENNLGYLWDRQYGTLLSTFRHDSIVNCVAVNPCDPSMCVTASDDHIVKVWHSKSFYRIRASQLVGPSSEN